MQNSDNAAKETKGLKVGFIGLGIMGAAMARRLVDAGLQVSVWNRTPARCAPLLAAGARQAASPADAAEGAAVVISMVTDSPDVEMVLLGEQGVVHGAAPGTLVIDMSTISPPSARRIGAALAVRGLHFVDAPVTGGDVGAREGTLSILVGGDAADLDRARPVFQFLGKRVTHCGPLGAGQSVKACNQILCALNMVGLVEALHLAKREGVDQALMVEALGPGAGGSWALSVLGPRIAKGDFDPGFMIRLIQKDLSIVQAVAKGAGLRLQGVALAQALFADNVRHDEGALGTQAMYKVLDRQP